MCFEKEGLLSGWNRRRDVVRERETKRSFGQAFIFDGPVPALGVFSFLAFRNTRMRHRFESEAGYTLLFGFLGWTTLNMYTQIGCITLVGLIAKNGILIPEWWKTPAEANSSTNQVMM